MNLSIKKNYPILKIKYLNSQIRILLQRLGHYPPQYIISIKHAITSLKHAIEQTIARMPIPQRVQFTIQPLTQIHIPVYNPILDLELLLHLPIEQLVEQNMLQPERKILYFIRQRERVRFIDIIAQRRAVMMNGRGGARAKLRRWRRRRAQAKQALGRAIQRHER